jgi:hypothetical protein
MDVAEVAKRRHELHKHHATSRPLSEDYELVGLAGEVEFGRLTCLEPDFSDRPEGDNGCDFTLPDGREVDVKTARKAYNLIHEVGKRFVDIYVLARYDDATETASLIGWETGRSLSESPSRDFGHGVINHYIDAIDLKRMADLTFEISEFYWGRVFGEDYLRMTAKPDYEQCAFCGGFNVHSEPCKELQHGWNVMEFGKHKGNHIDTVPDGYLEFLITRGIKGPKDRGKWLEKLQERSEKYNSIYWEEMAKRVTT